jgi:Tfp pilus assembly protein PilN
VNDLLLALPAVEDAAAVDTPTMLWVLQGVLVAALAVISWLFNRATCALDKEIDVLKRDYRECRRETADIRLEIARGNVAPALERIREDVAELKQDVKKLDDFIRTLEHAGKK